MGKFFVRPNLGYFVGTENLLSCRQKLVLSWQNFEYGGIVKKIDGV